MLIMIATKIVRKIKMNSNNRPYIQMNQYRISNNNNNNNNNNNMKNKIIINKMMTIKRMKNNYKYNPMKM